MPQYKYHYFSAKALGEAPRMLFAYGGETFEDIRVPYDQWPSMKSDSVFGQLPILEIDGKSYAQSTAISRYLGHKYKLAGATLEENLEIDGVVDFLIDIRAKAIQVHYDKNEESKALRHKDYSETNVFK